LVNMINKMKDDRSRIDNGADPLKFPNFPSLNEDETSESQENVETDTGNDFEEIIDNMRRKLNRKELLGEEEINLLKLYLALRGISFDQETLQVKPHRFDPPATKKTRGRNMIRMPVTTTSTRPSKKRKFMIKRKRPVITINNEEHDDFEEEDRTKDIIQAAGSGRNLNIYEDLKPETKTPRITTSSSLAKISPSTPPQVCECNCRCPSFVCPSFDESASSGNVLDPNKLIFVITVLCSMYHLF